MWLCVRAHKVQEFLKDWHDPARHSEIQTFIWLAWRAVGAVREHAWKFLSKIGENWKKSFCIFFSTQFPHHKLYAIKIYSSSTIHIWMSELFLKLYALYNNPGIYISFNFSLMVNKFLWSHQLYICCHVDSLPDWSLIDIEPPCQLCCVSNGIGPYLLFFGPSSELRDQNKPSSQAEFWSDMKLYIALATVTRSPMSFQHVRLSSSSLGPETSVVIISTLSAMQTTNLL